MKKIGLELRNLMNLIMRFTHKEASTENISMSHAAILKYLTKHKNEEVNPKDLEEAFMMRKSTVSRMLQLMESNGLIERLDDPQDSRKKIIKLTDHASKLHHKFDEKYEEMEVAMAKDIAPEDLEVFFKVLDQIKLNLKEEKEEEK
ncbi:MarR family winged helix-turn-helix transcriptional regulator [Acholeplasma hippikon]|uniref:Transcriptional regulator SlyA n=1 Tax=Acholeplasma hippikon TaxID=264636 RepID=A0A449BIM1_9MOLU|nr:MarR family transcriptional regulator [Acholeplasma hippikon]VEU82253.1 transcriptional regulator SlyA [Acholeplasma hippikon]